VVRLFLGSTLVNGRERQKASHCGCSGATIYPGQFESHQSKCEVLRPNDEAAFFRFHENSRQPGTIELLQHGSFFRRPLMGVALSRSHQPCYRSSRHTSRRLNQHLQIEPVSKPPLNLAHRVAGESQHGLLSQYRSCAHKLILESRSHCL
jgi:hypothetical protein